MIILVIFLSACWLPVLINIIVICVCRESILFYVKLIVLIVMVAQICNKNFVEHLTLCVDGEGFQCTNHNLEEKNQSCMHGRTFEH